MVELHINTHIIKTTLQKRIILNKMHHNKQAINHESGIKQ